jgi:cytochrome c5
MKEEKTDLEPVLKQLYKSLFLLLGLASVVLCAVLLYAIVAPSLDFSAPQLATATENPVSPEPATTAVASEDIVDGIHLPSGLIVADGFETVRTTCTACHSGKLVAQNRATRTGWKEMITWMQETQGLWPLGDNEPIILDYLATNYGPEETGRRANLEEVEWYILEMD